MLGEEGTPGRSASVMHFMADLIDAPRGNVRGEPAGRGWCGRLLVLRPNQERELALFVITKKVLLVMRSGWLQTSGKTMQLDSVSRAD